MISNTEVKIKAGNQNLSISYSYRYDSIFLDLLEYIAYLYPNYNICDKCFSFVSFNDMNNQNFYIPNNELIFKYSGYLNNLKLIKNNQNCRHDKYLKYSKIYIINHFTNEIDKLKSEENKKSYDINNKEIQINNLKLENFEQNNNINKLESEIVHLKQYKKEQREKIQELNREKKGLELAINGDIEKIKFLGEINIKGDNLKEKNNLIKVGEGSKIFIANQIPQKAEFINFYDVIVHIDSIKDINKGWRVEFSEKGKNNYENLINQKIIKIGVIGNSNKGKSFLLSRISKIYLPSGTSIRTEGLSIKYPELDLFKDRKIALLDSAGLETPVLKKEKNDFSDKKNDYFKEKSREKLITELFLQNYIINNSDVLIAVVGILTYSEQKLLMKIRKEMEKNKINTPLFIIHNLITYTSVAQVQEYINEFLMKSCTFSLEEGHKITTKTEQKSGQYFYEKSNDKNEPKVFHLIYTNEGSEAGKYYNQFTLDFLENNYQTVTHIKPFDVIETIKERYISLSKDIIEKTDNMEEKINNDSFDYSNPELIKLKDSKEIILKKCLTDELGFSNLKANGFEPTYNIFKKDDDLIIRIEAPGNTEIKTSIDYTGEYNLVKIHGEKKKDKEPKDEKDNIYNTRESGKFAFEIPLRTEEYLLGNMKGEIIKKAGVFIITYELQKKNDEGGYKPKEEDEI